MALSHTTGWRWLQAAGEHWRRGRKAYAEVPQSGVVASDATYVRIRGVWTAILGVVDGVHRTLFGLFPLQSEESDEEIEGAFEEAARAGLDLEALRAFLSDGAAGFREFLARCLYWVQHQRCIFHLWRNVLPIVRRYAAVAGKEWAKGLKVCIAAVWNAGSRAEAEVALRLLQVVYGAEPVAQEAVRIVQETFEQAMAHVAGGIAGLGRTINVCEWVWRYYKERVGQMGGFMSREGCANFNAVWGVAAGRPPRAAPTAAISGAKSAGGATDILALVGAWRRHARTPGGGRGHGPGCDLARCLSGLTQRTV